MAKRAWKSKTKAKEDIPAGTKMLLSDLSHFNYPVEVVNWSTSFNKYGDATHATVKTERGNLLQVPHFALHEAKRNPDDDLPRIFVKPIRKDGKIPVTYVFPISGRKIDKLITPAKLAEEEASGKYQVFDSSRRNPASAAELSSEFHGREPIEVKNTYIEEIYQSDLAKLGILTELEVIDRTGKYKVPIQFDTDSKSVSLAASPDGKQLYLCGGDQELELDSFDLPKVEKQFVSIGEVLTISYYTDKHHMSKAEAKGSEYIHEFGEEGGDLPTLVYDTLNKSLQLVGGSYEVKPEGITN